MSVNAPQQLVDLINHDTGRQLLLRDVNFDSPLLKTGPNGRNASVTARSAGVTANWGGAKEFRYWRLVINSDEAYVEIENRWQDWKTEADIALRFNEWLARDDVFSVDELLISTYQLIGQPEAKYVSVSVLPGNLKYTGNVLFRIVEPVFDWTGMVYDLNGFKRLVK